MRFHWNQKHIVTEMSNESFALRQLIIAHDVSREVL